MRLLLHTASLVVVAILMVVLFGRAADQEARTQELQARTTQLEIHDCGLRQYEDYSVEPQTSDRSRRICVGVMTGEIVCEERIVATELYLGNCERVRP